jgi:DNA-binding CsgD family transcriptional regulator
MLIKVALDRNDKDVSGIPATQIRAANLNHRPMKSAVNQQTNLTSNAYDITNRPEAIEMGDSHYLWITDLQGVIVGGEEDYTKVASIGLPNFLSESGRLRVDLFGNVDFSRNLRSEIETTLAIAPDRFVKVSVVLRDKFLVWIVHRLAVSAQLNLPNIATAFNLTGRELDVVHMLAKNQTERETSIQLNMAVATVRTHRRSIYQKLGVKDRCGLILLLAKHNDLR